MSTRETLTGAHSVTEPRTPGPHRRLGAAAVVLAALLGLSACNTAEGFGQDVQSAGSALEEKAENLGD